MRRLASTGHRPRLLHRAALGLPARSLDSVNLVRLAPRRGTGRMARRRTLRTRVAARLVGGRGHGGRTLV
ncbi:hypothetical protein, partial [Nocardiopsis sp. RV163]|uniref:hypothetical protein n=1 Tax=Nocardiopsis sp. RV163 TaxID=1661388 RepID=UPI000A8E715A